MGALTSNRKRNDEFLNLHYKQQSPQAYFNSPSVQNSKRQKLSMQQSPGRSISSKSAVSRISRYPEVTPKLKRELHAPVRSSKFPLNKLTKASSTGASDRGESSGDHMGNWLSYNYDRAKQSALKTLRHFRTEKEVIDVVDVDEPVKVSVVVSDDSSIEEIGGVEGGGAGKSVQSGYGTKDIVETVGNGQGSMVSELSNGNVRVENAEKMLDSLTLDQDGVQVLSKSTYKKLLEDAQKRDIKIERLDFEIKFNQGKRSALQELRPVKKIEAGVSREPFLPLTDADVDRVQNALSSGSRGKVLVTHENSNIEITGQILQCFRPRAWLNDEVINLYLELLKERENREPKKFLKCHFFNTFFYKKLIGGRAGYDYKSVRRWTTQRKLGYFLKDCDKIFVPIHKEIHWCLAIINKQDKKFQYLDSLGGRDSQVLTILARYFIDEVRDKSGEDVDVSSWEQEYVEDLPEQENGYDCGMFMIKYADFYSRGLGLCFSQEHMPYFRVRTAKEILSLRAD